MSFASRVALLALAAVVGFTVVEPGVADRQSQDLTQQALRQIPNRDAAAAELRAADAARAWGPLAVPAGLSLLAALLFWDDARRLGRRVPPR